MSKMNNKKSDYYDVAYKLMLEIGAIKTCEVHDTYYYNTYTLDEKTVYALATEKIKKMNGDIDFTLFHDQIKTILSEAAAGPDGCPLCAKLDKE